MVAAKLCFVPGKNYTASTTSWYFFKLWQNLWEFKTITYAIHPLKNRCTTSIKQEDKVIEEGQAFVSGDQWDQVDKTLQRVTAVQMPAAVSFMLFHR